jgi:starch phosphorylase
MDSLLKELAGGNAYLSDARAMRKLEEHVNDAAVLQRLEDIKRANKESFAKYVKKTQGVILKAAHATGTYDLLRAVYRKLKGQKS